ncbi:MAG TPA: hypothetical protein VGY57_07950, partial [Vicinamibacterales bacterium]|nr:hypothetical protein [Vicinamibacterales bacterium]
MSGITRTRVTLFVLFFASFAYFYQAGGWNQNSRFALVRAITNEGTLNIDPFQLSTGDKALFDGHYYSDKAPGISLTAVPVVAFARPIYRVLWAGDAESYPGLALLSYLATVFTAGLFTALAGVALFTICLELGASRGGALFGATTFALATPIWTLATIFIGHAFAAALLVFAFGAVMRIGAAAPSRDVRLGAVIGLGAGWAVVSDFTFGVPAIVLAIVAAIRAWPLGRERATRILGALAITAIACALVLFGYLYACFRSPLHIPYTSEMDVYVGMQRGFFGISPPRLVRLRRILFGSYRGLLPLAPVLALAPFGLIAMMIPRSRRRNDDGRRAEHAPHLHTAGAAAMLASGIAAYFILLNASYTYWEGGWSYGPRHA